MSFSEAKLAKNEITLFWPLLFICIFLVSGCSTKSRYSLENDIGPDGDFDASGVPNAQPVWEPLSRQGNKQTYTVRGIEYSLVDISNGFTEKGVASWYGLKFHGELTSNGEIYNMYSMSAAHKHLPIPSYVKVTNIDNDKQVIVRINDRGPFHQGRVIDLSYAAATKLGFVKKGTANVKLELVNVKPTEAGSSASFKTDKVLHFVQVAALSSKSSAINLKNKLVNVHGISNVFVASDNSSGVNIHRVRVGPFYKEGQAKDALASLKNAGFEKSIIIQRALSAKNI